MIMDKGGFFVNRILKQRARRLYRENLGGLLPVHLLFLAYSLAVVVPAALLQGRLGGLAATLLQMLLTLLLTPLILGVTRYTYLLQKGRAPAKKEALRYFTSPRRYGKAVAVGFLFNLPSYLMLLTTALLELSQDLLFITITSLLSLACYGFYIYWILHACLMPYILAEDEGAQLGHIRRESFRLMRGNCGRYFSLNLSFIGWIFLIGGVVVAVIMALIFPEAMRYARMGLVLPDSAVDPYLIWIYLLLYGMMYFLMPYVNLANAAFGDAALQVRLDELAWQARMPYGYGAPGYGRPPYPPQGGYQGPWQQPGQPPYPPRYPQGGGWQAPGQQGYYGQQSYGPQPGGWQPSPAQQEEASQYALYRQGRPMASRTFLATAATAGLEGFFPWPQVERSDLYSFLKLEKWMPGMVDAAWTQAAGDMAARVGSPGPASRTLEETLNGTRFRVTAVITPLQAGGWQVSIRIDLNPVS